MKVPGKRFRNIVITGASSGIGRQLALDYASHGITLGLSGRDAPRLEQVADACRELGAEVDAVVLDSSDRDGMNRWLTRFDADHPIELLVANAGVSFDQDSPDLEPFEAARKTMEVNFIGVLNTIEPVVGRMMQRRVGQIGLMSSQAAFFGRPYSASYNASKSAVRVWGESIRFPLARANVGVSVICPGFVASRMSDQTRRPKPGLVEVATASNIIRAGLARDAPRISFPAKIVAGVWFTALLPAAWAYRLNSFLG
jgi:short-subunit dehydrogenase